MRGAYNRAMAANPRHLSQFGNKVSRIWKQTGLAAKILMQQAEQQVVLPDAVDAEVTPRQALAGKAALFQYPDRRRVGGDTGGFDPVQIEFAEQRRQQHPERRRHVTAMRMGLSDPVSDRPGLNDTAAHICQRDPADHHAIGPAENDEGIRPVGSNIFGITAQPPPEA